MILLCLILAFLAILSAPLFPWATGWGPYPNSIFMLLLIVLLFVMFVGAVPCTKAIF
jgi:hypothetical protein